jgi:hypothetical protein
VHSQEPTKRRAAGGVAIAAFLLSLGFSFSQGWARAPAAMDFFGYYEPPRLWLSGKNPFDRKVFTAAVRDMWGDGRETLADLGDVACPLLPSALPLFLPLAILPPAPAALVLWVLNFAGLLFSLWAMAELWCTRWTTTEKLWVFAVILQSRLIQSVAYRGQPSLLMLAAVLAALMLERRARHLLAGFALVVASAKFTLAVPLVAYWIWSREWRPLLWASILGVLLCVPAVVQWGPTELTSKWMDSVAFIDQWNLRNGDTWHVTSWSVILGAFLGVGSARTFAASMTASIVACAGLLLIERRFPASDLGTRVPWKFAVLTALGNVAIYHRVYDGVMLFPLVVLAWSLLREEHRPVRPTVALFAVSVAVLLFVLAPLSVAQAASDLAERMASSGVLVPVNAWAALAVLVFTAMLAPVMAADRDGDPLPQEKRAVRA